jgi:hypothetical protein
MNDARDHVGISNSIEKAASAQTIDRRRELPTFNERFGGSSGAAYHWDAGKERRFRSLLVAAFPE